MKKDNQVKLLLTKNLKTRKKISIIATAYTTLSNLLK